MSGRLSGGAIDIVESLESSRGPDDEAAEMTTGGELKQVQGADGRGLNTGNVAETLDELLAINLRAVDNERTTALAVSATTELALASTELLGASDLVQVGTSSDSLEKGDGGSSAAQGTTVEQSRVDDERDLRDGHDLVTTSQQQRRGSRGSQGRASSISPTELVSSLKLYHKQCKFKLTSGPG